MDLKKVIHCETNFPIKFADGILYLYSSEPKAIKIYRKAGFVDFIEPLSSWSAWQEENKEVIQCRIRSGFSIQAWAEYQS